MAKPAAELAAAEHEWGLGPEQVWLQTVATPRVTWAPCSCSVRGQEGQQATSAVTPRSWRMVMTLPVYSVIVVLPPAVDYSGFPK